MEKIVSRVELSEDPALPGEILNKAESLFVAFQTGDFPYVLPFNHVWLDGRIYIHCALEGRKIDVLRRDGRVGFSTAVDVCIIREIHHPLPQPLRYRPGERSDRYGREAPCPGRHQPAL